MPRLNPPAPVLTLAVGAVIFGAVVVAITTAAARSPQAAMISWAGLAAAAVLTGALLTMVWARRRVESGRVSEAGQGTRKDLTDATRVGIQSFDLGGGQIAIVFDDLPGPAPRPAAVSARRDRAATVQTGADADSIMAAVKRAVEDADGPRQDSS